MAALAYFTRCQSVSESYQKKSRRTRGGYAANGGPARSLGWRSSKINAALSKPDDLDGGHARGVSDALHDDCRHRLIH